MWGCLGFEPRPCIYYAISLPTELCLRGPMKLNLNQFKTGLLELNNLLGSPQIELSLKLYYLKLLVCMFFR
jgi:hypothetical protein